MTTPTDTYDNANRLTCTATRMNPSVFASPPASACLQGTLGSNGPDRITLNSYDAANELTKVTTGYLTTNQASYATLTYTANGFAQTVLDAANNLTTVVYDPYDRPYQVQFPMPTVGSNASNTSDYEQYGYDSNSNLTSKRLRSGDSVTFAYDALNRPTSETFPAGKSQNLYWGYDLLNRQLSATYGSPTGTGVAWTYDALGRVTSAANAGRTLLYQYDAASNRTRMTWPDTGANALYVQYVYDVLNRVTQIEENGATSGAGLLASYQYDSLGRRSSVARAGGSGAGTGYTYDGASRLYTLAQTLAGSASVTYTLGYNAAGQIVSKALNNSAYIANPAPITAGYTANGLNQYTAVTGITASYVAANSATLTYDPTGALQTETTAGATTTLLYDGTNLVGEYSGTGTILNRYVPGPGIDEPVLWYQGSGTSTRSWLTADNQGSVIGYADQNGNSGATYAYGPHGEPITSTGASAWGGSRYRFTGQIEIPEAQLYYYKARMYDPAMGRFYQTDPVGLQSDVNIYAYATNDPINATDPTGLVCYSIEGATGDTTALSNLPQICSPPPPGALSVLGPPSSAGASNDNGRLSKFTVSRAATQSGTPHRYIIRVSTLCPARQVFNNLKEAGNSAPGAPAATEGTTKNIPLAGFTGGTNPITQIVNSNTLTITNITQPGHIFDPGQVVIQVISEPGDTSDISIVGTGTGPDPLLNEITGLGFFGLTAQGAAAACASSVGVISPF